MWKLITRSSVIRIFPPSCFRVRMYRICLLKIFDSVEHHLIKHQNTRNDTNNIEIGSISGRTKFYYPISTKINPFIERFFEFMHPTLR